MERIEATHYMELWHDKLENVNRFIGPNHIAHLPIILAATDTKHGNTIAIFKIRFK